LKKAFAKQKQEREYDWSVGQPRSKVKATKYNLIKQVLSMCPCVYSLKLKSLTFLSTLRQMI